LRNQHDSVAFFVYVHRLESMIVVIRKNAPERTGVTITFRVLTHFIAFGWRFWSMLGIAALL